MSPVRWWRACLLALPLALTAQVRPFPHPKPDTPRQCAGAKFTFGRAEFSLAAGTIQVLQDGDRPVGFYYEGSGSLTYRSEESAEHAVMTYNLEHNSPFRAEQDGKNLSLRVPFTRARFWISGAPLPVEANGEAGETRIATSSARWDLIQTRTPVSALALAAANPGPTPYVRAEMGNDTHDWLYEADPVQTRMETLALLKELHKPPKELKGWLFRTPISNQPLGWNLRQPQPGPYALTDLDLHLETPDNQNAVLKVKEKIVAIRAQKALEFDLVDSILDDEGTFGLVFRREKVKRVATAAGQTLPFHHDHDVLTVMLPQQLEPGQSVDLEFDIEGNFLVHPGGSDYTELGIDLPWYPRPDLNGAIHTFHSYIKVKSPWQPFASGDTVRRVTENGYTILETATDKRICFPAVLAGDYAFTEETREGRTVRVATFALKSQFTKQLADMAFQTLKYYEGFLGPYPFKEFQILEKNQWGYGQAPAGLMFITKEAFNQSVDIVNKVVAVDVRHRFVHEIAHQWWGVVVKMPSAEEQWLTESFADICAGLCLLDWKGKGDYLKRVGPWKSQGEWASKISTIPMANMIRNEDNSRDRFMARQGLIYNKGAYLLHCIRQEIGDELFFKFLKSYQATFKWRFGTTKDVAGLLKVLTGKDWQPWFEKYYWGTEFPVAKD